MPSTVFDLDAALGDPAQPTQLLAFCDSGNHLLPNTPLVTPRRRRRVRLAPSDVVTGHDP
jgi:hypothetical protein